jgi:hypothetical protein
MKFLRYAVARGKEPSTYAGLAAVLTVLGFTVDPGTLQNVAGIGTGLSGLAAMFLRG